MLENVRMAQVASLHPAEIQADTGLGELGLRELRL